MALKSSQLTLNILHALLEDLVEYLGVLELLLDLGNDGVCELPLLSGLDLAFVADPRVKNSLCLSGELSLLLELVCLGLELSGFLQGVRSLYIQLTFTSDMPWKQRRGPW